MTAKRLRRLRRVARLGLLVGIVCQTATCFDTSQLGALVQTGSLLVTQLVANVLSDTVFFFVDNFFVRVRGG